MTYQCNTVFNCNFTPKTMTTMNSHIVPFAFDDAKKQAAKIDDCFVVIFKEIKRLANFNVLTNFYAVLKWLDANLNIILTAINNIICNPTNPNYQYNMATKSQQLIELKTEFMEKLDDITIHNVSIAVLFNASFNNYFNSINIQYDLDFRHHNTNKYSPKYNTSGYYSGLQKDWMDRIFTIDHIYKIAEHEHNVKLQKKRKSIMGTFLSAIGYQKSSNINNKYYALQYDELKHEKEQKLEPKTQSSIDASKPKTITIHIRETSFNNSTPVVVDDTLVTEHVINLIPEHNLMIESLRKSCDELISYSGLPEVTFSLIVIAGALQC